MITQATSKPLHAHIPEGKRSLSSMYALANLSHQSADVIKWDFEDGVIYSQTTRDLRNQEVWPHNYKYHQTVII